MSVALIVFIAVNIGIALGYGMIARYVVPSLNIRFWSTKIGGFVFFVTCAASHVEFVLHAWTETPMTIDEFTSWHMMVIHVAQFVAVWSFMWGLYKEVGITKGFLRLDKSHKIIKNLISDIEDLKGRATDTDVALLNDALRHMRQVDENIRAVDASETQ